MRHKAHLMYAESHHSIGKERTYLNAHWQESKAGRKKEDGKTGSVPQPGNKGPAGVLAQ